MADSPTNSTRRVGFDISNSAINAAVVEADDSVSATFNVAVDPSASPIPLLVDLIERVRTEVGGFERIAIAVPGLVDRASGKVAYSANIPHHSDVEIVKEIKAATGLNVCIENDANAAAYGEYRVGAGKGSRHMFYATLGEGVGGAFIFDGRIWRGAAGFAGEFGYVPINSEGTRLEDVASSANIIRRTRSRFHQDNTSSLNKLEEESITLEHIISAAENDDDFAQMMLERTGNYVGTAIASVINLLNIEKIVLGGAIMAAKHLVLNAVVERARELSFAPSFDSTRISEGSLNDKRRYYQRAAFICGSAD